MFFHTIRHEMIMVNIFINFFIDSVFCNLFFIHKSIIRYGNTKNAKLDIKKPKIKEDSKIFELEKNTIVGTYQKSRNFGFVVPDDKKLGTDIYIAKKWQMCL